MLIGAEVNAELLKAAESGVILPKVMRRIRERDGVAPDLSRQEQKAQTRDRQGRMFELGHRYRPSSTNLVSRSVSFRCSQAAGESTPLLPSRPHGEVVGHRGKRRPGLVRRRD